MLAIVLGGYETFKLENSLIGAVYPTVPKPDSQDSDEDAPGNQQEARRSMMFKVVQRGKYFYNYSEYLLAILLRAICCCCASKCCGWHQRRVKKLERHEAAS